MYSSQALKFGLSSGRVCDRQFVATDAKNRFITGRKYPKMVLVEAEVTGEDDLVLRASSLSEERVRLPDWRLAKKEAIEVYCISLHSMSDGDRMIITGLDRHLHGHRPWRLRRPMAIAVPDGRRNRRAQALLARRSRVLAASAQAGEHVPDAPPQEERRALL
jgi:hypothetical protein